MARTTASGVSAWCELWLAGFRRVDLRPHMVGGLDVAAREVEELAVSRMICFLHALDMRPDRAMLLGQELGEQVLLLRRANNDNRPGVGDCLRDILEERLVLFDPLAGAWLAGR